MQTAIVIAIVLAAAVYALRQLRKPSCGCGGSCGASANGPAGSPRTASPGGCACPPFEQPPAGRPLLAPYQGQETPCACAARRPPVPGKAS